ncbi:MAG: histidinol dehydrogenase, partial [Erythrobacter sp.]
MQKLNISDADFAKKFDRIVRARRESDASVAGQVRDILHEVKARGDDAVAQYSMRFDGYPLTNDEDWVITKEACAQAYQECAPELRAALELAADRIRAYHTDQLPANRDFTDDAGVRQGAIWRPVDAAGLYVPGGRAAYPSSLLMNAIPARVAGVERLVVVTPTPKGKSNPLVLAAAHLAGVDEIWRIGGAHGVGALAYGTDKIA